MKIKSIIPLFAIILLGSNCLSAQSVDFNTIVDSIAANNPDLHAGRLKTEGEIKAIASDNNLADPELDFTHQWGQEGIGNKWSIGVTQSFEWPGVYSVRARRMNAEAEALRLQSDVQASEMRLQIAEALVDLVYQKKLVDLHQDMLDRIDSMIAVSNRGLDRGEVSILDLNIIKLQRIEASRSLNEAVSGLTEATATLKALNGGADCKNLTADLTDFPDTPLLPLDSYIESAAENNPVIRYNDALSRAEQLRISTLRRSYLPGFSIGYNHEYEIGDHFNGLSVGLTLPVFSNRKKIPAAEAQQLALQAESEASRLAAESQITRDYKIILQLDNELREYSTVLSDKDNMRLLSKALNAGQISILDYFSRAEYFLNAQAAYLEAQRKRAQSMARLSVWR